MLLSSHLIHEIEMIADELVVIGSGKIVAQGSKESMLTAAGTLVRGSDDQTRSSRPSTTAGLAFTAGLATAPSSSTRAPSEVGKAALAGGVVLTELRTGGSGLEEMFLELTADDAREEVRS